MFSHKKFILVTRLTHEVMSASKLRIWHYGHIQKVSEISFKYHMLPQKMCIIVLFISFI